MVEWKLNTELGYHNVKTNKEENNESFKTKQKEQQMFWWNVVVITTCMLKKFILSKNCRVQANVQVLKMKKVQEDVGEPMAWVNAYMLKENRIREKIMMLILLHV